MKQSSKNYNKLFFIIYEIVDCSTLKRVYRYQNKYEVYIIVGSTFFTKHGDVYFCTNYYKNKSIIILRIESLENFYNDCI